MEIASVHRGLSNATLRASSCTSCLLSIIKKLAVLVQLNPPGHLITINQTNP